MSLLKEPILAPRPLCQNGHLSTCLVGHGSLYVGAVPLSTFAKASLLVAPLSEMHLEAMRKRFRKCGYASTQIDGAGEVTGLAELSWSYIKSGTFEASDMNRGTSDCHTETKRSHLR